MAKSIKYMRVGDPTVTRNLSVSEKFARENGWVPYEEPQQVEPQQVEPVDGSSINTPNIDQIEKPDKPNTPLKPKTKARK